MKILFVGVFTEGSTNVSQRDSLLRLGHTVDEFPYRSFQNPNLELLKIYDTKYDILLIAKGNNIEPDVINLFKYKNKCSFVYWFMDPLMTFSEEMLHKTIIADAAYFDKKNVLEVAKKYHDKCYYLCEGYDETIDTVQDVNKEYDISFIGNVYNNRGDVLDKIKDIKIISNAYGKQHSIEVGKSKINLNICTDSGASDRVYKVLAAGGFLLTDDWEGRELTGLEDEKHLVIYKNLDDLKTKIKFYLKYNYERERIAKGGLNAVKNLTRDAWARGIVDEK
jgi:spore maturation protein CgeB